ncbi:hypothetical protein [Janthinobacterium sp. YR213]|uniref:hypothetical protein n=1 Tax=Janthinobacterium sp. YR213 TaxID=1881027 RepID=UPI00147A73E3|nr:hypothetical protein [Janthinobacterium sp. YR213]
MGLRIEQSDNSLKAVFSGDFGEDFRSDLTPLLILGRDLDQLLLPILDGIRLKRPATIKTHLLKLRSLGETFIFLGITELPTTEDDWQKLVLDVHRHVLTRKDRTASLKTRSIADWQMTRSFFLILAESGIMPISVILPIVRENMASLDISPYQNKLLGKSNPVVVTADTRMDKLLYSISLSRTDAEYLDEVRDSLTLRRNTLKKSLTEYWKTLKENLNFGIELRASVNWEQLTQKIDLATSKSSKNNLLNPNNGRIQLANYLTVIQYKFNGYPPSDDKLRAVLGGVRNWPLVSSNGVISSWAENNGGPAAFYETSGWSHRQALWWWLGRISHFDVSMLTALLILLQPSWTPGSIIQAKIENRHGKSYLDFRDDEKTYTVEKPRAKAMKEEILDPIALDIISTLIECNKDLRNKLIKSNDPKAHLLFLPYGKTVVSVPSPVFATAYLSGSGDKPNHVQSTRSPDYIWIGNLFPELVKIGLGKGTISFKKIRATEGVLEWFRTKSLRAVSKKLGNTERVALQHYIPKALLDSWNTRIVRRFQNLLIVVAAADTQFLLDVSDFANTADLHAFLVDMLRLHGPTEAPLAQLLHEKFGFVTNDGKSKVPKMYANPNSQLHVSIGKAALTALYSYQTALQNSPFPADFLDKVDPVTGLSPRHFISLTDLLQMRLPKDKNPEYVACHQEALAIAGSPKNLEKWERLLRNVK